MDDNCRDTVAVLNETPPQSDAYRAVIMALTKQILESTSSRGGQPAHSEDNPLQGD